MKVTKNTLKELENKKMQDSEEYNELNKKILNDNLLYENIFEYNKDQIDEIAISKKSPSIDDDSMSIIQNPDLTSNQMEQIRLGYEQGLDYKQVSLFAKPMIHANVMEQLRYSLQAGMSMQQVKSNVSVNFDWDDVVDIHEWDALLTPDDKYDVYEETELQDKGIAHKMEGM